MNKLLLSLLMMSVLMVGCAKEDEESVSNSDYRSCYVVQQGNMYCYDLGASGLDHSEVALACAQFQGTAMEGACGTSYDGVGSVGLCTGVSLTDGTNTFTNVKSRYYIAADANAAQQTACVTDDSGTWNAGQ